SQSVEKRTNWLLERPGSVLGAQMNLRYAAALALLDGAAYVEQFTTRSLARDEVWDLMDRIDVVRTGAIDELGASRRFVTFIDIELTDGSHIRLETTPPQDVAFSESQVVDKFDALTINLLDAERRQSIIEFVLEADHG